MKHIRETNLDHYLKHKTYMKHVHKMYFSFEMDDHWLSVDAFEISMMGAGALRYFKYLNVYEGAVFALACSYMASSYNWSNKNVYFITDLAFIVTKTKANSMNVEDVMKYAVRTCDIYMFYKTSKTKFIEVDPIELVKAAFPNCYDSVFLADTILAIMADNLPPKLVLSAAFHSQLESAYILHDIIEKKYSCISDIIKKYTSPSVPKKTIK